MEPSALTRAAVALETEAADAHDPAELQRLLAAAVRAYAALRERGEADQPGQPGQPGERGERARRGGRLGPFPPGTEVTATDACVAASAMLEAVSVEVFELAMFETWAVTPTPDARDPDR
jgi:hypothetical protein